MTQVQFRYVVRICAPRPDHSKQHLGPLLRKFEYQNPQNGTVNRPTHTRRKFSLNRSTQSATTMALAKPPSQEVKVKVDFT